MDPYLIHQICPSEGNPRNSEGAFLRAPNGEILFAYSRYTGSSASDDAACDIALIRSTDNGRTFSEPEIIARAAEFGTANIMSVSALPLLDGTLCFWFLIKEPDGTSTIGRTYSTDGKTFRAERCECLLPKCYYVINNDRMIRLADGRIAVPLAAHQMVFDREGHCKAFDNAATMFVAVSDDEGRSFCDTGARVSLPPRILGEPIWTQEPGIFERTDGAVIMWMRTNAGSQYVCVSYDRMRSFTMPEPSELTSPCSPLSMLCHQGKIYAAYNPIPEYNGRCTEWGASRTPLVIRISEDAGRTWGPLNQIGEDPARGYCYASMFAADDETMLLSVCRGAINSGCLKETGIYRIPFAALRA